MRSNYFKGVSLKTKMAVAVTSLFILFIVAASYFTFSYFERTFKESVSTQQFTLVSSLAHTIDDKLRIAQNALIAVASTVPRNALANAENAQLFLNSINGYHSIFDNNISFISTQGKLIAESRYLPGRRGKDLSYREWVQKTIATRKPYISEPYISTHIPIHPAIVMTVPIFDGRGNMEGMLVGSIDLLGKNFLADLSRVNIGKTGYLYISDSNRVMIVHPDKNRIMQSAGLPGRNKLYERALQGFEGSEETVNTSGIAMLSSFKHLTTTSWILAANYPIAEAYAPLYRAERYLIIAVIVATVMLLLFTWLVMKRLMLPLAAITRHVKYLPEKPYHEHHINIDSEDEIGVLANTFNAMVDAMNRQHVDLNEQKQRIDDERAFLETLINAIPDMIFFKDQNGIYQSCNDACAIIGIGVSKEKVIGRSDKELFPAETADLFRQRDKETMDSGQTTRYEEKISLPDGRQMVVESIKTLFRDAQGNKKGVIGIARDITERKLSEEKLHDQALLLEKEIAERQVAQEALSVKQLQLERMNGLLKEFNDDLEERISQTVLELRHKDRILIQQSRQADMGEMINNIAHQWRQPLNNIGLVVQNLMYSLANGELTGEMMKADVKKIMETISFMSQTIDDFRNYFKPDKDKTRFNINLVVTRTLSIIEGSIGNIQITIKSDTTDDHVVFGYPNEYSQVVLNILLNAKDVLYERKIKKPEIEIAIFTENGKSVVTISDNAGGIPENIIDKIFAPYFSTKGPEKGTGIGLYLSKNIIEENMGGRLAAYNTGEGAVFRIEI